MRTYIEIYQELTTKSTESYSLRELIDIFVKESSWIGKPHQLLRLKSISHEITGIRPGECSACNIEVVTNLNRWLHHHEANILESLSPQSKAKKAKV